MKGEIYQASLHSEKLKDWFFSGMRAQTRTMKRYCNMDG